MKLRLLLIVCLWIGHGKSWAQETTTAPLILSLERTTCYGNCPYYSINIYADGRAVYEGKKNVELVGKYTATAPPAVVQELLEKAISIDYVDLNPKYPIRGLGIIDFPVCISSVRHNGVLKTIYNRNDAPALLVAYEQLFDELTESLPWQAL
ncbi:MAG: DUF6438 domain-containing protein [Aureispira sp.]